MPVTPHVVLEHPLDGVERVAQGDVDVFVRVVPGSLAVDGDLLARHVQQDPHVVELPLVVVAVRRLVTPMPFVKTWARAG
jgi:hypothetical protein